MNFIFISPNFPKIYSHFIKYLKKEGFTVLGIGDEPFDNLNDELKENLDEYCFVSDMNNYDWMKNTVKYLKDKYGEIDYLESNNEYWMKHDSKLREDFNIKNGYLPAELEIFQSKSKMKEYFKKAGVKSSRFIIVSSLEESLKFIKKVNYPIFAKPDTGVGATSTYKIENEEQLIEFHNLKLDSQYILEEYIDGYIISFDGIANDKAEPVISFKETFPTPIADIVKNDLDVYYYAQSQIDDVFFEMGKNVVKSFNIRNRCFHIEFFVLNKDKKGLANKGDIIALEANLRSPGGDTPELLNIVSKYDYYETYAKVMKEYISPLDNSFELYSVSVNRKNVFSYAHSHQEIIDKYSSQIIKFGSYPELFRNAMGDTFYIAKFEKIDELEKFVNFIHDKNN